MKKQRTKQHYIDLLDKNPNATIGFTLAAQAVYAARNGVFDANAEDHNYEAFRAIARGLKMKYGENLTVEQVRSEIAGGQDTIDIRVLNVPGDLHRAFKIRCAQEGVSLTAQVIRLIEEWVKKGGQRP